MAELQRERATLQERLLSAAPADATGAACQLAQVGIPLSQRALLIKFFSWSTSTCKSGIGRARGFRVCAQIGAWPVTTACFARCWPLCDCKTDRAATIGNFFQEPVFLRCFATLPQTQLGLSQRPKALKCVKKDDRCQTMQRMLPTFVCNYRVIF